MNATYGVSVCGIIGIAAVIVMGLVLVYWLILTPKEFRTLIGILVVVGLLGWMIVKPKVVVYGCGKLPKTAELSGGCVLSNNIYGRSNLLLFFFWKAIPSISSNNLTSLTGHLNRSFDY